MNRVRALSLAAAGSLVLATGCGGGGAGSSATSGGDQAQTTAPAPSSSGGTAATTITGSEFKFVPASASAANGSTVTFKNGGTIGHDLKLRKGNKIVAGTDVISAGTTATLTLNLPPGKYVMFCSVPGHEAAGMKGTFTVK